MSLIQAALSGAPKQTWEPWPSLPAARSEAVWRLFRAGERAREGDRRGRPAPMTFDGRVGGKVLVPTCSQQLCGQGALNRAHFGPTLPFRCYRRERWACRQDMDRHCTCSTRDGTRTHNLLLRREAPYPLGHTSRCAHGMSESDWRWRGLLRQVGGPPITAPPARCSLCVCVCSIPRTKKDEAAGKEAEQGEQMAEEE